MINGYDIDSVKYYVFRVVFRPDSFDCCSVFQSKSFENWNKPMERYLDKQPIFVTFRNILLWLWLWLLGTLRSKALIQMCIFFSCAKHCNSVFDCYFHSNCKKKKNTPRSPRKKGIPRIFIWLQNTAVSLGEKKYKQTTSMCICWRINL